jgi:hypothetical protein
MKEFEDTAYASRAAATRGQPVYTANTVIVSFYQRRYDMNGRSEPVFVNVYGAQESIPRIRFRQPM